MIRTSDADREKTGGRRSGRNKGKENKTYAAIDALIALSFAACA